MPSFDDVAGHHYDQQRAGTATFLVCWYGDEPLGWGLVYRRLGYRPTAVLDGCSYSWFDAEGHRHDEVESAQLLVKDLSVD